MLQFLLIKYLIIRDSINVIKEIDSEIELRRFKNKKTQLKIVNIAFITRKQDKRRVRSSSESSDKTLSFKKDRRLRCFIYNESHRMRDCELLNEIRVYVFKQVVKKRDAKISDVKYSKRLKKHREYTANVKINTENIDFDEDYAEKTIALLKNVASKISRSE